MRGLPELMRLVGRLLLAGLAMLSGTGQATERPVAFLGATVIDGTGRAPVQDAVLVVDDGRVVALGSHGELGLLRAARIEVDGRWIIPGLIDAHVHFFQSGGLYTRPDIIDLREIRPYQAEIAAIREKLPETLARYVASGVTSVVDVGGPDGNVAIRARANALEIAPRIAVAGPLLGTYAPPELQANAPPIVEIATPAQARAEVRRQLQLGVDLIKIWFVFPEADLAPALAWVRAAVEEAHAAGVRVVRMPRSSGSRARWSRPASTSWRTASTTSRSIERRLGDPDAIASLADLDRLPPEVLPPWVGRARPRPLDPVAAHNLRRVQAAGITIAAGSDAGNIGTLHGPSLHRELELMVQAGLTPMQVLVAATRGGAAVIGRADIGVVAPGQAADFVILEADPLADIRNTRRIWRVVQGGNMLDPEGLFDRR